MRTLLTQSTTFYCNTVTGNLANDGLTLATPLPQPQDVLTRLQGQYDLGGQVVTIECAAGQTFKGVYLSGSIVGQAGASGLILDNANIVITDGSYGVGLAYGAALTIHNCAANTSGQQDVVNVGAGSHLVMTGTTQLYQEVIGGQNAFNHISVYINSSLSIYGELQFYGAALFGIDSTTNSYVAAECNTVHGRVSFSSKDTSTHPTGAYFYGAFVDAAGGFINLAGVDFKNPAYGYRYQIRWGGTLFINQAGDPSQLESIFGTADTAFPIEGYLN